jgi:uncharacterized damage-inducible protein DinB
MPATETEVLLHALDHAYDATSWHGPNLRGAVRGLSHVEAAKRPAKGRHNVWELAVHCAYWKYTVRRRLLGEKRGSFPLEGSNWFRREAKDGAARWKADIALLDEMHASLRQAVEQFPASHWKQRIKGSRWTYRDTVAGVAAHDLYHAGQMRLVKVLRGRR